MDTQHVKTAVPLLRRGYDMLLEKPFAVNEDEMWELQRVAGETGRRAVSYTHLDVYKRQEQRQTPLPEEPPIRPTS